MTLTVDVDAQGLAEHMERIAEKLHRLADAAEDVADTCRKQEPKKPWFHFLIRWRRP
jgi:hypothetical protein